LEFFDTVQKKKKKVQEQVIVKFEKMSAQLLKQNKK